MKAWTMLKAGFRVILAAGVMAAIMGGAGAWAQPATADSGTSAGVEVAASSPVLGPRSAAAATTETVATTMDAAATTETATSSDTKSAPAANQGPTAREYLDLLETKNEDVRSMVGSFTQTRTSAMFHEKVTYAGKFSYLKPNRFRIDYTGKEGKKDESTVLMLADEVWDYVPSIKQVTRMRLDTRAGQQREINQFLLGFGVQAKKALQYFDVALGKKDPTGKTFTLVFKAKDPDDTMQFVEATITFDRALLRPKTIVLIDSISDQTEISLGHVEYNAKIKESIFEPKWPKDVDILNQ